MSKGICGSDSKKLFKNRKENCNMVASEKKRTVSFPGWQPHTRIRYGAKIWPCARMVAPCGMISLTETTFSRFRLNVQSFQTERLLLPPVCCLQSFQTDVRCCLPSFPGAASVPQGPKGIETTGPRGRSCGCGT